MSARKSTKREFDWRSYTRPPRVLTAEQESAFCEGLLRPLLDLSIADRQMSLEIRARQATLYYRGASLVRLGGTSAPFSATIDANLRLPRAERPGAEKPETWPLETSEQVSDVLAAIAELRACIDSPSEDAPPSSRELLIDFAKANRMQADSAELIALDIEYSYGHRRFDFVGMRRATSVGGPAAFTTPRLVIGELYTGHRPPNATAGLTTFGADAAEFARALGGEHLGRAKAELRDVALQRQRMGLLPATPFSHFADGSPELLVVFVDPDFIAPTLDAPLSELHDRAVARHFPTDLLHFAAVGPARPGGDDRSLTLREDDILPYRAFKGMRKRLGR
jgi:hypothetical protein